MSDVIQGFIENIVYRNADNGYTVLSLKTEDDSITCVGNISFISEGECFRANGKYITHAVYGEQFLIESYEYVEPEDVVSIERYLASGAIKGVGPKMASRIVAEFKEDTFLVMEKEPERLAKIKGISERMAMDIYEQFEAKRELRGAMIFLQQYGISSTLAVKIYEQYHSRMYDIIRQNPYQLAEDISGIAFKTADEIAMKVGLQVNSEFRIKSGILYDMMLGTNDGHVYLPEQEVITKSATLLGVSEEEIQHGIADLVIEKKLIKKQIEDTFLLYTASFYYMELNVARMLCDLNISVKSDLKKAVNKIDKIEEALKISLDNQQRTAVVEAMQRGLLVITGGPGTGKTTTINTIIKYLESEGLDILLAAPTGRAAKRMTETTGYEAKTIHRLLELTKQSGDDSKFIFERNENNPLETDALIIDEMSMVDLPLMNALLKAVPIGTRLILVGDVNQLPSVGAGNILKDIIASHRFPVVMLTKIFRQAQESDIVLNAHKINAGEQLVMDNKSKDFFLLKRDTAPVISAVMVNLIKNKLPNYVNATPFDIQVITPMRKGELGVERLNQVLQEALNPPSPTKKERESHNTMFREGDKVMQIKNNYQLGWEIKSSYGITVQTGTGVFNGDTGIVKEVNLFAEQLVVEFDDSHLVEYPFSQLDELDLAYAITVHKSQGSEYAAVVLPLLSGPKLLFNRNLLYTAVTRAKSCVTIVGSEEIVHSMIANVSEQKRYTTLDYYIRELDQGPLEEQM